MAEVVDGHGPIEELRRLVARFASLRVLVVGDLMLDCYVHGTMSRLAREAPAPILDVGSGARQEAPGGAGNAAANIAALGGDASLLGVVGRDEAGDRLVALLGAAGVGTSSLMRPARRETVQKERLLADRQMVLRLDRGTTTPIDDLTEQRLISSLRDAWRRVDAVLISDYEHGVMTPGLRAALGQLQAQRPRVLVVDAKDAGRYRAMRPTAVKPNSDEAFRLLGEPAVTAVDRAAVVTARASELLELTGAEVVAVTLDHDGAIVFEADGAIFRTYAGHVPIGARTAGAGDTFAAALTLALAARAGTAVATELASRASDITVGREGTTTCSAADLRGVLGGPEKVVAEPRALEAVIRARRARGDRIVFTNGCFDLVHRGHVGYLSQAKALGDFLVVGLNGDASVSRLKGAGRPINGLDDRAQVLAALSCVDLVAPFDEDTPERLVRLVGPDVYVKGGDYSRETLPEALLVEAMGGQVMTLPYFEDRSTTGIIERIRASGLLLEPDTAS